LLLLLLLLLLSLLLLLLPKLHARVGAWCQRWEGGGPWTNHGARLEGLQVAGEEGRLEASARTALDDTAVGWQLVVVVATGAEEDGLASARLVGSLLGSGAGELELVAELGAHHWRSGRLEEVLGSRALGRGHHWELVGHLISIVTAPWSTSVPLVPMRPTSERWAPPMMLPLPSSLSLSSSPTVGKVSLTPSEWTGGLIMRKVVGRWLSRS